MKDNIINELKNAYNVKPSDKKNEFLRSIKKNDMSILQFILLQTKYLHSLLFIRCFLFSLILVFICIYSNNEDTLLFCSALIPFIVIVIIYEIDTSRLFKMEEIEQATKFSLRMIIFARMFIAGIVSLLSLLFLTFVTYKAKQISMMEIITSFFLPYFLSVYGCLVILRKYREGGTKYSFILTTIISLVFIAFRILPIISHMMFKTYIGMILLIIFMSLCIIESKNYIKNLREVIWN